MAMSTQRAVTRQVLLHQAEYDVEILPRQSGAWGRSVVVSMLILVCF
jgi:hypothetical protein